MCRQKVGRERDSLEQLHTKPRLMSALLLSQLGPSLQSLMARLPRCRPQSAPKRLLGRCTCPWPCDSADCYQGHVLDV